ncbi:MAG: xanthine dehydrogenase family protein molybdopterin-binding subunit [Actinomycetota bacterium]|nr:xanthine dehydrogenase family protein molybdopterin-binding subunit [Actinomycetota bacterium]
MTETTTVTPEQAIVVEEGEAQRGFVGVNVPRKEDKRLVQGAGLFFDDIKRHNMGYLHFVRSPYAHAKIKSIDVSKALELDGVYGTLTGDEVAILTDPFFELSTPPGAHIKDYAIAVGKARFVGEPVAAVVARTRELAADAAELVEVEYEPLQALVDGPAATDEGAPILHDEAGSNVVWSGVFDWGDYEAAKAEADHVVKIDRLHFERFSSTPLECSGCLVEFNRGTGQWTMYCNHQMPGVGAIWMAPALRVGIDKLRFVTQDIGGAFGNKICLHPHFVACCLLARKLNRPVQWTEWRTDQHMANAHGNERTFLDVEVPVKKDGTMLGFSVRAVDDCGAFPRYEPLGAIIWAQVTPGCYRWRNIRVDFTQVCTNKSPVSPNRGYSRMQHLWLTERIVDIVAGELELDPVEVRKLNYVKTDEMPYETPNGCIYDSGDYARCLDIALELIDYASIEEKRREAESRGKLLGIGIGSTLDSGTNNFGQSMILNPELQFSGNNEVATVKLDIFGEIVVTLGTVPQGQGHETTASQVVADILGCTPDDVNVRPGHDSYWNSHAGFSGTYASQFAVTGLGAVKGATEKLREEMKKLGSVVLGCSPDDLELAEAQVRMKANHEAALPFMALGAILNANNAGLPEDLDVTLNCRYVYRPPFEKPDLERKYGNLTLTYATQIHACVVEIDPETGAYEIVDYAAVDDCGNRIHPQIVEGQVHGATAQALGAATHEQFVYDEDGNLLTPNFYDYHVPHAMDMPPMKNGFIESASPFTPLGAKGMGEGGGAGIHAVCAALQDALRTRGKPIVYDSCNPYHRVWEMLQNPEETRKLVEVTGA